LLQGGLQPLAVHSQFLRIHLCPPMRFSGCQVNPIVA
jgi:hypothetical protein